jgi:hypothetical protein
MTRVLSPLPSPFPAMMMEPESRTIPVQSLPVSGGTPFAEPPPRPPLPALGIVAGRPAEAPPLPPAAEPLPATAGKPSTDSPGSDFTDADLSAALLPLVAGLAGGINFHDDAGFEAVLRATFRRALAEHQAGPFQDPDLTHRILWRAQALFTSRSYHEVLADKIGRFSVEEVYLLDRDTLSLVSYASCDPVRHTHPRRVGSFARQLGSRVRDESGALQLGFELGENRRTFVRPGRFCHLVAIVRGELDELVKSDFDFALRRIESRFHGPFVRGEPLLKELQPLLEECLLIHSPAAPAAS